MNQITRIQTYAIVGRHLLCAKGHWALDKEAIETEPNGFTCTLLPPTFVHGLVRWEDHFPVEYQGLTRYAEALPVFDDEPIIPPWHGFTAGQLLTASGELATFTSAFGARKTFMNLWTQYEFWRGRKLPLCTVDVRPRNDEHGNIDPVFRIKTMVSAANYAEILDVVGQAPSALPQHELSQIETPIVETPPIESNDTGVPEIRDEIDEEIPF